MWFIQHDIENVRIKQQQHSEDNNVNMSGRGRGQCKGRSCGGCSSGGRGSHGKGHGNQNSGNKIGNSSDNESAREQKKMFEPHCTGKHQVDTHNSVKEQIVTQAQKKFKNPEKRVAVLRAEDTTKADLMKPTLTKEEFIDSSGAPLKDAAKAEADLKQEENNMVFREELRLHNERKDQIEDNTQKAYALTMQTTVAVKS